MFCHEVPVKFGSINHGVHQDGECRGNKNDAGRFLVRCLATRSRYDGQSKNLKEVVSTADSHDKRVVSEGLTPTPREEN